MNIHKFSEAMQNLAPDQAFLDMTHAAYNAPGGIGTLLEQLLLVQSRQVDHLEADYPVLAHPFWKPVVDTWNDELYHKRYAMGRTPLISPQDLEIIYLTDDTPEIVDIISTSHNNWKRNFHDYVKVVDPFLPNFS